METEIDQREEGEIEEGGRNKKAEKTTGKIEISTKFIKLQVIRTTQSSAKRHAKNCRRGPPNGKETLKTPETLKKRRY